MLIIINIFTFDGLPNCVDRNECDDEFKDFNNGFCVNTEGSFELNCFEGFELNHDFACVAVKVAPKEDLEKDPKPTRVIPEIVDLPAVNPGHDDLKEK